jgi:hypothetical protein
MDIQLQLHRAPTQPLGTHQHEYTIRSKLATITLRVALIKPKLVVGFITLIFSRLLAKVEQDFDGTIPFKIIQSGRLKATSQKFLCPDEKV